MASTVSPQDTSWDAHTDPPSSHSRRLLAVVAGAVLFVLGIVIGGFMARSDTPQDLSGSHAQIAALRAEVNLLNIQSAQAKAQSLELEQLLVNQQALMARGLMTHEQTQTQTQMRGAEEREVSLDRAIEMLNANRQVCLNELQQFQRQPTSVPTSQVIRFAETMFETQIGTLNSLASGEPLPANSRDLQTSLAMTANSSSARGTHSNTAVVPTPAASQFAVTPTTHARSGSIVSSRESVPTLAEPTLALPTLAEKSQPAGVFFTAPPRRGQGLRFFTPRPPSRVASRPGSGMTFTDASDAVAGPAFR